MYKIITKNLIFFQESQDLKLKIRNKLPWSSPGLKIIKHEVTYPQIETIVKF
jgi:hypothetical protein